MLEVVRLLIDNGADPDCKTEQGATPLQLAMGNQHDEVTQLLREKGDN